MRNHIRRRIIGGTTLALFISGSACAVSFFFGSGFTYEDALTSWPDAVVVGDVTGDGRDDAVLATSFDFDPETDYNLFIYAQTAQGTLKAPVRLPYLGTVNALQVRMQIADLNNDGIKDIVVGHDQGITVVLSRGNMRFAVKMIMLPGFLSSLAVADLDRDGNADIVRQSYDNNPLSILMGDGTGAFTSIPGPPASAGWHQALKIADVTGDGLLDLVFTNQISLTIYPGKGNGAFMPARVSPFPEDDPRGFSSLVIADVNHDGRGDVLATTSGNPPHAKIWLYRQQANGTLAQPDVLISYDIPEALMATDLDRNGYEDILTMHGGWDRLGVYFQDRLGLGPELGAEVPRASHYNQDGLAAGDLDSDGCTDVTIADYNHGLLALHGDNCYQPWAIANRHDGDFDGDGAADILWHNTATGASVIWKSGNSATQIPTTRVTDTRWTIAGVGDFNGDGRSDILWHHVVTGANTIWDSGDSMQSSRLTRIANLNWEIVGIGDFDDDGKDDILWRHRFSGANTLWNDGHYSNSRNLTVLGDMDWKVAGVGDFDGDGKADIFWRHAADGRNVLWRNANSQDSQATSMTDLGWYVAGLGDFDDDGHADILWHHAFDGRSAIWSSASDTTSRPLTQVTNLTWKVAGIADYAHDGHADILWRNSLTGANIIWRDTNATALQRVTGVTNMNWKIMR